MSRRFVQRGTDGNPSPRHPVSIRTNAVGSGRPFTTSASILPSWSATSKNPQAFPCERRFWLTPQHMPAAAQLVNCKGFITSLPIHWLETENVRIEYPTGLIVQIEPAVTNPETSSEDVQEASRESVSANGAAT